MQKPAYNISMVSITVNFPGLTKTVLKNSNPDLYDKIKTLIKAGDWEEVKNQISIDNFFASASAGHLQFKGGQIFLHGLRLPDFFAKRIMDLRTEGLPFDNLVKFFVNLQRNPSKASRDQLFGFLEANHFPITDNGNFIAYKGVRSDFTDCHTGTFDNSPGTVVSMPRDQVNPDPNQTCSHGLHVASYTYAKTHFGGGSNILLEVEVNPEDVVAVPTDYQQSKMRVCRYKVIGLSEGGERSEQFVVTNQSDLNEQVNQFIDQLVNEVTDEIESDLEDYGSSFND